LWLLMPLGVAMLLLSGGCAARKHSSIIVPSNPRIPKAADFYTIDKYKNDVTAYNTAAEAVSPTTADLERAKYFRNKIANNFMGDIDYVYGVYTDALFAGKGFESFIGDAASLGLTTASAISVVARTKTILSALATGVSGVALSADKNFFAQQTFQSLAMAMQARRDQARATIIDNLQLSVTDYPLAAVRRDLVSYFYAGTLTGALQEIQQEAAKTSTNALGVPTTKAAGAPAKLAFSAPPVNGTAGSALAGVVVQVQDANGVMVPSATNTITISSTPAGVSGPASVNAVAGAANFIGLTFSAPNSYTLTATSAGLTPITSNSFTIASAAVARAPAKLAFSTPPVNGTAGSALAGVVVQVQDANGVMVPSATNTVTISSTPAGVTGPTSVNAVAGAANFIGLTFSAPNSYTLTATSAGLTPITSDPFTISPAGAVPRAPTARSLEGLH
jgi:hypothetical protein